MEATRALSKMLHSLEKDMGGGSNLGPGDSRQYFRFGFEFWICVRVIFVWCVLCASCSPLDINMEEIIANNRKI